MTEESLSDYEITDDDVGGVKYYWEGDVRKAVKKLKERGLKKTTYPKYLMITNKDLKEIFGDKLTK